jgi:glycosyltransferase involved in cell wall biosynthesis
MEKGRMGTSPKASILIENYNYADYLGDAIESALAQDYNNFEVVVVDDGSTDDSREVIQRFGKHVKTVFKANGGLASAFNAGVSNSQGELIFFLDSDDSADRNRLSKVIDQFETNHHAQWVFHQLRRVAADGRTAIEPEPEPEIKHFDLRHKGFHFPALSTSGLCFRRSFASRLFPLPEARACLISDNYLKFAAVLLAPGIYMGEAFGSLRIHGLNDGSAGQPLPYKLHADILMALEMYRRLPELGYFTHRLAAGTVASARTWGDGGTPVQELFEQYLQAVPFVTRCQLRAGVALRQTRNRLVGPTLKTHGPAVGQLKLRAGLTRR